MHLGIAFSREHKGKIDIILHREGVQQIEFLKNEAEPISAEARKLGVGGEVICYVW